ncbi:MAG: hypothetical protein K0R97_2858 [Oerskovia sp.]|jgi:hypothetical protein|nr:hypothetical protein [Oerskovia sp.]
MAAGEGGTSGWFEGWVGGLAAAAVTLAFTAWWETRRDRRQRLEAALDEVSAAADAFFAAASTPGGTPTTSLPAYWRLAKAVPTAQWELTREVYRWRRVIRRVYRSRRLGFSHALGETWERLAEAKDPARPRAQALIALELSTLGILWRNQPEGFPRAMISREGPLTQVYRYQDREQG